MGVLTHLDGFKDQKKLKKTKKALKHRFWAEIYQGVLPAWLATAVSLVLHKKALACLCSPVVTMILRRCFQ